MSQHLSQRGYARHRGCDVSLINRWIKAGRIPTDESGKVDPVAADAALADMDRTRGGRGGGGIKVHPERSDARKVDRGPAAAIQDDVPERDDEPDRSGTLAEAQKAKVRIQTKRELAAYRKEVGELVERGRVEAAVVAICGAVRRSVQLIPDNVASRAAAEDDERKVRAIIMTACEQVLSDLADAVAALPEQLTATRQ